jgi:ribosome maturation factor RimP
LISAEQISTLLQEKMDGTDMFLVSVHVNPGNKIEILMDSDSAFTIENCVEIHRFIESKFDREVEDYSLEVSSPGLSQPLKVKRQYTKNIGRDVAVKLKDGKKLEGTLSKVTDENICLSSRVRELVEGTKKKAWVEKENLLPFDEINETKIVISFK